jgi:integrase
VSRNVARLARPPRVVKEDVPSLSSAQVKDFLVAIKGNRLEALDVATLGLGLRQGEVLGLRWSDIDLERSVLRVSHALQWIRPARGKAGVPTLVEPKSRTSRRTLDLPPIVADALRAHRARWRDEKLALGPRWLNDWNLVFTGSHGEPLNPKVVWEDHRAALKTGGLPLLRFHDLRHSCASLLLLNHVPAKMVQEILGHSSITLKLDTYSHVMRELREQAVAAQTSMLGG